MKTSMTPRKKNNTLRLLVSCLLIMFTTALLLIPSPTQCKSGMSTLLVYHSRTGTTKLVCETLQKNLNADLLEIKDTKDRSGTLGFISASIDAFRHNHSPIEPEQLDLSSYDFIVVASPVWSWNLSTPIHTLFEKNRFDDKKLVLITTANIHIMKYEEYGDDAPFIKKFLRDYLRGKRKAAVNEIIESGGEFVNHYHIETKGKSSEQIVEVSSNIADDLKEKLVP